MQVEEETIMAQAKLPALVVGSGFGCRIHVPALRAAGFDVVGLVGTNAERTERRAGNNGVPAAFTDLDQAIARTGAAVVTIASPPSTHAALSLAAIARGCHVLCEKPFAMNTAEARAMLAAAERAGVVHLVGHEFRWAPDRALVRRAIAEGMIGEPRFMTIAMYVSLVADPEAKMPRWWFDQGAGGGWLGASGSHTIDQVRTWLGEFESLSAALSVVSARTGVADDSYVTRFRLAGGVEGVLQQTGGAWGPIANVTRVAGTHGTLWIEDGAVHLADRSGARQLPVPADLALPPPPPTSDDPRHIYSHLELGPYTRLCEAMRAAIEGRPAGGPVPLPTFADGVACTEVLDAIRKSAASGGALINLH
jgi:predicted dehydrogenase